jgi:DNA-binding NtrC family response regulator
MSAMPVPKVVLVDADEDLVAAMWMMLERQGYSVVGAYPSVRIAQEQSDWDIIDSAAVNYMLQGEDTGDALIQWLHDNHPHVRRVLMTAFSNGHLPPEATRNAHTVIRKPFSSRLLAEALCPARHCNQPKALVYSDSQRVSDVARP